MRQLEFDTQEYNYLVAGEEEYFLYQDSGNECHLVRAHCPHRGGPLYLGERSPDGKSIVCPWHQTRVRERVLKQGALTVEMKGTRATVHIEDHLEKDISLQKKTILVNEGVGI